MESAPYSSIYEVRFSSEGNVLASDGQAEDPAPDFTSTARNITIAMPPNRFAPSKYKNQLLEPSKSDKRFSELPSIVPPGLNGRTISCNDELLAVSLGNSIGLVEWREPRKLGGKMERIGVDGTIADFEFSRTEKATLGIVTSSGARIQRIGGPSISLGQREKFSSLAFHSHARGLLSLTAEKSIDAYSIEEEKKIFSIDTTESMKQHSWEPLLGRILLGHSVSNVLRTYDPRTSPRAQVEIPSQYMPNRPSSSAIIDDTTLLSTGTLRSTMIPTIHIYDLRNPAAPKTTFPIPTSTSPSTCLYPLVDPIRKLAYLPARNASSIYALDLSSPSPMPITLTLPTTLLDATLLPPHQTDVMRAEINRLYVLSKNEIIPVSVRVERKSYLDFHEDLFPDVFAPWGVETEKWGEESREKVSLDPERQGWRKTLEKKEADKTVLEETSSGITNEIEQGTPQKVDKSAEGVVEKQSEITPENPTAESTQASPSNKDDTSSQPTSLKVTPPSKSVVPAISSAPRPSIPGTYARSFLTGAHHHPSTSYTSLPSLPTLPSHRLLHATSKYLLFPIAGPGGRLVVLPLEKTGRYSESEIIEMGCGIVDFEGSHVDERVIVAGEDGSVRVFDGKEEVKRIQVEKVVQVAWHPLAGNVVGVLCVEQGNWEFRAWDCENGDEKVCRLEYSGYAFEWSLDGKLVCIAGGDNCVHVLDPRKDEEVWRGKDATSSTRPYRVVFAGDDIISVGFTRSSSRQICLFNTSKDTPLEKITLDTSPSPLIPYFDHDTSILFLWSKGSRQIHPYHLTPTPSLTSLPVFASSDLQNAITFLPKRLVNVRKVEIISGLRFTSGNKIERFGFTIPRNKVQCPTSALMKMEFFQDDIYIPTRDLQTSSLSAQEWFNGDDKSAHLIDLRPSDMTPRSILLISTNEVSSAPADKKTTPQKQGGSSFTRVMGEKERENQAMEEMFSKAKRLDVSDDEIEGLPKAGNTDGGYAEEDWD